MPSAVQAKPSSNGQGGREEEGRRGGGREQIESCRAESLSLSLRSILAITITSSTAPEVHPLLTPAPTFDSIRAEESHGHGRAEGEGVELKTDTLLSFFHSHSHPATATLHSQHLHPAIQFKHDSQAVV